MVSSGKDGNVEVLYWIVHLHGTFEVLLFRIKIIFVSSLLLPLSFPVFRHDRSPDTVSPVVL